MKSENIDRLRRQFRHEWLLIAIDKVDQKTTTVQEGHLLAHSPSHHQIYNLAKNYQTPLMTVYSEDWPEDLAAAFPYVNIHPQS
ncbi:MAG: hypothetical protein HYS08_06810 [Chlamydiae bacterium]|nr:hypothetical protein [Chlamydiota bacterium]MBI3265541.1 hypothetical protein [Chlamydiota bacterium]